jgi:hypothetical protein
VDRVLRRACEFLSACAYAPGDDYYEY